MREIKVKLYKVSKLPFACHFEIEWDSIFQNVGLDFSVRMGVQKQNKKYNER